MAHSALTSGQLNQPLIRGWLQKRSRHMKQWRKRWVILQEFGIYTFKTDTNIISQATEIIDLHTIIYVKPCSDLEIKPSSDLPYCFEIYCINVTFIFNAESLESMNLWTKNIQQQLFKTYLNTNSLSSTSTSDTNKINTLWICPNCAFKNSLSKRTCKFCGNAKTHKTKIISSSPHKSEPVVNLADIVLNNIIGSDEDIKEEPVNHNNNHNNIKKEQRWLCEICTFENIETLPFCEICGAQRPKKKKKLNIINLSAEQLDIDIKKSGDYKCSFNHIKCPCINRIISILIFYQKWLINVQNVEHQQAFDLAVYQREIYGNNGPLLRLKAANKYMPIHGNGIGVYDFINEILENYSNILLLNDFNHILTYHCYKREMEEITKNIMRQFISNKSECGLMRCICLQRNHRDHTITNMNTHRHELYFIKDLNDANVNEVVTQQILDRIHCRLIHSFQLYQFRDSEYQKIRNTHSLKNNNVLHLNHNRLKTIRDIMNIKKKNLLLLRGKDRIKNSKYTTQISSQYKYLENKEDELDDDVSMKFGKRCFYWKFYGSKKWYILRKYENLKLELMNNKFYTLSVIEYNDLYAKCIFLSKCNKCKVITTKEKNISHFKYYGLNKDEIFGMDHIMAMLLYCNNDILCNIFIKTYDLNTDMQAFKKQHREYAQWARLMREVGECFGDELVTNNETFYHGISSQQLLFGETIRFNMPKSCTSKLSVGLQYASDADYNNGLILEIEKNKLINDGIYYFSKQQCEIFSDFSAECESVFIGGYQSLKLKSILNIVQCENYKVYLSAIHYFQQLIIGHYPSQSVQTKSTIIAFNNLIKNEIRNEEEDMKSEKSIVPQYISNLFHVIALKTNHKITLKIDDICKYYHTSIKELFISPNNNWCKLNVLISLFPNVEKIWIENLQIDDTTMVKLYTFCESICYNNESNTQQTKYNPQLIKLNEIIIVDAQVKIDLNDKNYLSQIQKPFRQIIWNISLDFHDQYSQGIRLWK